MLIQERGGLNQSYFPLSTYLDNFVPFINFVTLKEELSSFGNFITLKRELKKQGEEPKPKSRRS